MITEDYVSFETSKLLKEKGFNEGCRQYWYRDNLIFSRSEIWNRELDNYEDKGWTAPTIQMAMKWLREVHNKIIVPGISLDDRTSSTINHYNVGIWYIPENNGGAFCYTSPTPYNGYPSFEEACESGIRYCLENLI